MPPSVWARDLKATGDQPVKHHVETTDSWPMAQKVRDYIAKRVDGERWAIDCSYATPSKEPTWDAKAHMREVANAPPVEGEG
jgi:hypothetical protein